MFDAAEQHWREGCLGDLIYEVANRTAPGQGGDPDQFYVGLEHMEQGAGRLSGRGQASEVVSQKSRFEPGDILYGKLRPNLRKVARPDFGGVCSTDIVVFRSKSDADADYAFQLLQSDALVAHAVATAAGTKMPRTHARSILAFECGIPPLDEQKRIAETLRSIDQYAVLTSEMLSAARSAKNATLIAALGETWPETTVGELLAATRVPMRSGPFGSALLKSELKPEGIPLLGIDNVHVERFVPVFKRFVSREKYRELARYTVYPNDVMVTIMGTVGRCCVVPSDIGVAISSKHTWTITLDCKRYSPPLLAWQINHAPWVLEQLRGAAQGGIMSAISSGTLRELVVPNPPSAELREIEDLLISANATISALEAEMAHAAYLKAALTNDLLSGRVRVPA